MKGHVRYRHLHVDWVGELATDILVSASRELPRAPLFTG